MLFNSFVFLLFITAVVAVYFLLPTYQRALFLLVCSYLFYAYWDWRFLLLIWLSTAVDFWAGQRIFRASSRRQKKVFLMLSVGCNLGILGFFKYFNFFTASMNQILVFFGLPTLDFLHLQVILPVGISFYTFQTLSYTIDVYRGKIAPCRSVKEFSLFVSFFPQLVAGPIERAAHLLPQIKKLPAIPFSGQRFQEGIVLITLGMFRKVLIGDSCGRFVDHIFAQPSYYSSLHLLMGLVLFTVQIYNDFAGYSHIARGTAKLFGIELSVNFRQPYLARNIADYWRRWHISLTTWVRDYIFFPLGGSRQGRTRILLNTMVTMLLLGLWHGAQWTFVIYGGIHGIYLCVYRFFPHRGETAGSTGRGLPMCWRRRLIQAGGLFSVNLLVIVTRILFRAENFHVAAQYARGLLQWRGLEHCLWISTIMGVFYGVSLLLDVLESRRPGQAFFMDIPGSFRWGVIAVCWLFILISLASSAPVPFYYFQF